MPDNIEKEIEFDVVRLLLKNKDFCLNYAEHLSPNYFSEALRPIVDSALSYYKNYGKNIPFNVLALEIKYKIGVGFTEEKAKKLFEIIREIDKPVESYEYTEDYIVDFIKFQRMENAVVGGLKTLQQIKKTNDNKLLEKITSAVNHASEPIVQNETHFVFGNLQDRTDDRLRILNGEVVREGIPLGIPKLDSLFPYGGLEKKHFGLFLGLTGTGKTIVLLHCCWSAIQRGYNALFVTFELAPEMIFDRIDSMMSGIEIHKITDDCMSVMQTINSKQEQPIFGKPYGEIVILDMAGKTANAKTLEHEINKLKRQFGFIPDLLAVDYMDLMVPNHFNKNNQIWKEQQVVAKDLRDLGNNMDMVVWSASQANRGAIQKVEDGGVIMEDNAGESFHKQTVADFIVSLNQTKAQKSVEGDLKEMVLYVVKNRIGKAGSKIHILTAYNRMSFYEGEYDPVGNNDAKFLDSAAFDSSNSL